MLSTSIRKVRCQARRSLPTSRLLRTHTHPGTPDTLRLADYPGLRSPSFCFGRRLSLPSTHFLCIIEYALSYRGPSWRVLRAKTSEMGSRTPRATCLRTAVLARLRRRRYQNEPGSPRELYLRISRPRAI